MRINNPKDLAVALAEQRKKLGKTQTEMADLTVLRQATVSQLENNPENTQLKTLFKLLSALNLELHLEEKGKAEQSGKLKGEVVEW